MTRLVYNLLRWPGRALHSQARRRNPAYGWQRQADREVPRWFGRRRMAELEAIPGTTSARKCRLLAFLAAQSPPGGCIVEIGAYQRKSTAWLVEPAQQLIDPPTVVSIDPHRLVIPGQGCTWELFQRTVARFGLVGRGLEVQRASSRDVGRHWHRPIALLWIDGSHDYADVCDDIDHFTPQVVRGGWIVFDDAHGGQFPGVERAVAERMAGRPGFRDRGTIKDFRLFQRE